MQVHGRSMKQLEYHRKFPGMFLPMKSRQAKISKESKANQCKDVIIKAQQRPARRTNARALSTIHWVILKPFPNITCLSGVCSSKSPHALSPGNFPKYTTCLFSAKHTPKCLLQQKHPLIRQFPEEHHMTQLSLQQN